ncbi:MAG: MFS transporter [Candidatus Eremiobacteraeota bacterium]|nr:MFS transporter [Candidatus Eremiobacteraeota bacterium]
MFIEHPCERAAVMQPHQHVRPAIGAGTWVLIAAVLGSAMPSIDGTAVNVILPIVQRDLHADARGVQWIVEGYALFLSALILVGGALGDLYGRRRIFVIGTGMFAVASLICAMASNMAELISARCLQGSSAALLVPESLALISAQFPESQRGRAIGTWSSFSAISTAVGPVLGGYLSQHFSWRWVFLINVPIAATIIYLSLRHVVESRDPSASKRIDVVGASLASLGLGGLVYALIAAQGHRPTLATVTAGVVSAFLLALFVYYEKLAPAPMMPLKFFRSRQFSGANAYTLLLYAGLGGSLFFIPFNLINVQHYSPTAAGAAMLPMIVLLFLLSRFSGGLQSRVGPRAVLFAGAAVAVVAFVLFALTGQGRSYWISFFPASVVLGLAAAIFVAPLTATVMNSIESAHAGMASGINNAIARTAGLLAVALLGIVLTTAFYRSYDAHIAHVALSAQSRATLAGDRDLMVTGYLPKSVRESERQAIASTVQVAFLAGFRWTMILAALMACAAALTALVAFSGTERSPAALS